MRLVSRRYDIPTPDSAGPVRGRSDSAGPVRGRPNGAAPLTWWRRALRYWSPVRFWTLYAIIAVVTAAIIFNGLWGLATGQPILWGLSGGVALAIGVGGVVVLYGMARLYRAVRRISAG